MRTNDTNIHSVWRRWCAMLALAAPVLAQAQLDLGTTDQSDGDLVFSGNATIDLNRAVPAPWNTPSPIPGFGVYDGQKWAVVFKCNNLTVQAGATVRFINRQLGGNPPVVFLVQGNAQIDGTIDVSFTTPSSEFQPGPGGFGSGSQVVDTPRRNGGGRGPGGADSPGTQDSSTAGHSQPGLGPFAGRLYGNPAIVPIVGGSGAGWNQYASGNSGAGGGAILIACRNNLALNGSILARGAGGSGGAIKLLANNLSGGTASVVQALSPSDLNWPAGSPGRIRLEFNQSTYAGNIQPLPSIAQPTSPITIWPGNQDPSLVVEQVGAVSVPTDPNASWQLTQEDVTLFSDAPVTVRVRAYNVPLNWRVEVRIVPRIGATITQQATLVAGNQLESVWETSVTFPRGQCAVQARAWL